MNNYRTIKWLWGLCATVIFFALSVLFLYATEGKGSSGHPLKSVVGAVLNGEVGILIMILPIALAAIAVGWVSQACLVVAVNRLRCRSA